MNPGNWVFISFLGVSWEYYSLRTTVLTTQSIDSQHPLAIPHPVSWFWLTSLSFPAHHSSSLNCPALETLLLTLLAHFPDHSWLLPLLAVLSWWQWGNCHIVTPAPPWYTDRQISTQAVQCPQEQAGLCPFESQVSDPSCPEKASFCQPKVPEAEGNSQQLRLTFKALLGIDKSTEEGFTDLAG